MSTTEAEARDAYVAVEVPLPNGAVIRGKPVPWREAVALMVLHEEHMAGGAATKTLVPLLARFFTLTGIDEAELFRLCPDLQFGELVDLMNRFFFQRRPAPTAAPPSSPAPLADPPPAGS